MPWRRAGWAAAALLLVAVAVLLTRSVSVSVSGSATCGSAWDVVSGRTDWSVWWGQDGAAPVSAARPVRTQDCPAAVNDRLAVVGVLTGVAVLVAAGGELMTARSRPSEPARPLPVRRLRRLGAGLALCGALATAAGAVGVVVVTSDPHATVFDYVDRSTAVVVGLLLLLPAPLLLGLGLVVRAAAAVLEARSEEPDRAP